MTKKPIPTFEPGDVIKIPFPYGEKPVKRFRPALVVSSRELQELHGLLWVLMITSAKNRPWAGDVEITHLDEAGLPAPSVVRCAKIAAIDSSQAIRIGRLDQVPLKFVEHMTQRAWAIKP